MDTFATIYFWDFMSLENCKNKSLTKINRFIVCVLFSFPDPLVNHKMVLLDASEALRKRFDFVTTTIQVEDYKSDIMSSCNDCQDVQKV